MGDISLLICGEEFVVRKDMLCEYSDYFQAMFSGNYVEKDLNQIEIDVVNPSIMKIILQYMKIGLIDLYDHSLQTIGELAMAANFLQITELIKQIKYTLYVKISISNWMDIMAIAENASYKQLEEITAAYGLFALKLMKVEYIKSIKKLFWYLSNAYLDSANEYEVFKFGQDWILQNEIGPDALLIIIGCLDVSRLSLNDLSEIKSLMTDYDNSLAAKVIDCLYEVVKTCLTCNEPLSTAFLVKEKSKLFEKYTETVYSEVLNIVKESKPRKLKFIPCVSMTLKNSKPEESSHYMYRYIENKGFQKWLEIGEGNLWGWNVAPWNATKLIVVGGEYGKGTGHFMKDVKVYDTLNKEWIRHGVELPSQRHASVAVINDSLYIIGGVGAFRVVLNRVIEYNLKSETFRKLANIPDAMQNPAVCAHNNVIYTAGHKYIYRYEDLGHSDGWKSVIRIDIHICCMVSYKDYIYCTQNYFTELYRFRPNYDTELQIVACFTNLPTGLCNLGGRLIAITGSNKLFKEVSILAVEEYKENDERPLVLWSETDLMKRTNESVRCCSLVMDIPPLDKSVSQYHNRYLMRYSDTMSGIDKPNGL